MSMDLSFWKYKENAAHDHAVIYQAACCDGKLMEKLEDLPIDEILKKISAVFSDWMIQDDGKDFEKEGHGLIPGQIDENKRYLLKDRGHINELTNEEKNITA